MAGGIADALGGIVQRRRARASGAMVAVIDAAAPDAIMDADEARWWTICEAHGSICSHRTLALARIWAAAPLVWCEHCEAMPGHLEEDGSR